MDKNLPYSFDPMDRIPPVQGTGIRSFPQNPAPQLVSLPSKAQGCNYEVHAPWRLCSAKRGARARHRGGSPCSPREKARALSDWWFCFFFFFFQFYKADILTLKLVLTIHTFIQERMEEMQFAL